MPVRGKQRGYSRRCIPHGGAGCGSARRRDPGTPPRAPKPWHAAGTGTNRTGDTDGSRSPFPPQLTRGPRRARPR